MKLGLACHFRLRKESSAAYSTLIDHGTLSSSASAQSSHHSTLSSPTSSLFCYHSFSFYDHTHLHSNSSWVEDSHARSFSWNLLSMIPLIHHPSSCWSPAVRRRRLDWGDLTSSAQSFLHQNVYYYSTHSPSNTHHHLHSPNVSLPPTTTSSHFLMSSHSYCDHPLLVQTSASQLLSANSPPAASYVMEVLVEGSC